MLITEVGTKTPDWLEIQNLSPSLWTRIDFEVPEAPQLDALLLRMKYNDGFVAYVNGQEIARRSAPHTPGWNSTATA